MDRNCRFSAPYTVMPSACDHCAKLGYAEAFALCQDLATRHADELGLGISNMATRGLFWLTVRTRLHFYDRPRMMDALMLETWPVKPEAYRGLREYQISKDGKTLITGVTEWAVIETAGGRLQRLGDVFGDQIPTADKPEDERPFLRLPPDFSDGKLLGVHRVCSNDIDLGKHMNNVAYLRALLGLFDTKQLDAMPFREIELCFRNSCYEGDELRFFGRRVPDGMEFAAFADGAKPSLLGKLTY